MNDSQGLSVDLERHPEVVAYTVLQAIELLQFAARDAASGQVEFYNELEGYWLGLPGLAESRAAVEVDDHDRLVSAYCYRASNNRSAWFFSEWGVPAPQEFFIEKLTRLRALYLVMSKVLEPPMPGEDLGVGFIESVLAALTDVQRELWERLVGPSRNGSHQVAMLLRFPRAAGGHALIGVGFSLDRGSASLKTAPTPITVRRHTKSYMRERGGAFQALSEKHVVLIGCGSVGSELADGLASSGVGRLTLVDLDHMSEDNVFRHVLGPNWIDSSKVKGLKVLLEMHYPGVAVTPVDARAQDWLSTADLSDVDAFVMALGAPTLERFLARELRARGLNIPLVCTWLEPLDVGGHSVLAWTGHVGCLDCLYRDDEGLPSQGARTAFLAPGQTVSRNLTGCGSSFVPYGALQSRRTALLALEHVLEGLGPEPRAGRSSSYRFWVGPGLAAASSGLALSPWWRLAPETSAQEATKQFFRPSCQRCRGTACA